MKTMSKGTAWAVLIGVSLFLGVMIGWVAPLAFPPLAQVAQPIVCPGGELAHDVIREESPDEITYNSAFQCYRGDGATGEDVTANAIFAAIGVYSVIAFVLLFLIFARMRRAHAARLRAALRAIDAPGVVLEGRTVNMRAASLD
ncbi:MAG: hypothetical protein AAGE05_06565, partial [Pseudomonadota bacterium]